MASTVLRPPADRLAALLAGLNVTSAVIAYVWSPKHLDGPGPWGLVELPGFSRHRPDESERQIGSFTWEIDYPVTLLQPLVVADPDADQEAAAELVEAFVRAVDADPTLGGTCEEAVVAEASEPVVAADRGRALIVIETVVAVEKFVLPTA